MEGISNRHRKAPGLAVGCPRGRWAALRWDTSAWAGGSSTGSDQDQPGSGEGLLRAIPFCWRRWPRPGDLAPKLRDRTSLRWRGSHITHLYALLKLARSMDLSRVYVHAILDGGMCRPGALGYLQDLEARFSQTGTGRTATVSGRYYHGPGPPLGRG